jgi:hypothetical protein
MSATLYNAALVLHIMGITIMAGTAFIDFITFRVFCKVYATDVVKGLVLESYLHRLQRFLGIGMLLIIISGVAMMIKLHEVWGAQLWFRVKMGLLVLVIFNGLAFRRRLGAQLKKLTAGNAPADERWSRIKRNFTTVQAIQLLLFTVIYILSVFKFNY